MIRKMIAIGTIVLLKRYCRCGTIEQRDRKPGEDENSPRLLGCNRGGRGEKFPAFVFFCSASYGYEVKGKQVGSRKTADAGRR